MDSPFSLVHNTHRGAQVPKVLDELCHTLGVCLRDKLVALRVDAGLGVTDFGWDEMFDKAYLCLQEHLDLLAVGDDAVVDNHKLVVLVRGVGV
jgi:hypothetical protein